MCTQPVVFFTHRRTASNGSSFKLHAIRDCYFSISQVQPVDVYTAFARVLYKQSKAYPKLNNKNQTQEHKRKHHQYNI